MPAKTPGTAPIEIKRQARRLEIGGQEHEDHEHGDRQADPQRLEHRDHRRELAHGLDPHAAGRRPGGVDRLRRPGARPGPCPHPRRSRSGSGSAATCRGRARRAARPVRTVATSRIIRLTRGLTDCERQGLDIFRLFHPERRHLNLDQVVEAGLHVDPVVEVGEPGRRRRHDQRRAPRPRPWRRRAPPSRGRS